MPRLLSTITAEDIHHKFANATALTNNFNSKVGSSGLTTVIGHFGAILRKTFNRQLRGGGDPASTNSRATSAARAADNSQFEGNCSILMGELSIWPSILTL